MVDDRPDPVEVVAEAIHLAREIRDPTGWDPDAGSDGQGGVPGAAYVAPWDELGSADRRDYREQAEAALDALRSRGLLPEGQKESVNPSCESVETAVGGSTRGTPPDIGAGTGRAAATAAGPGRDVGGRPGHRSRQVPEPLEGEAERLRAELKRLRAAVEVFLEEDAPTDLSRPSEDRAYREARHELVVALSPAPEDEEERK